MTRFTETDKWRDKWFLELNPLQKILFLYLCDNCNNAGFIEINPSFWAASIGCTKQQIEGAWQGLGRGLVVGEDWAFLRTYHKHQKHLPLNEVNPAHRQIIRMFKEQESRFPDLLRKLLEDNKIEGASEGLPSPLCNSIGKGIGKKKGIAKGEQTDDEWLADLKTKFAAIGVNVDEQRVKAEAWISTKKGLTFTRKFFVNWLARCDANIQANKPAGNNSPLDMKAFAERL
jgi:hypothetical protein